MEYFIYVILNMKTRHSRYNRHVRISRSVISIIQNATPTRFLQQKHKPPSTQARKTYESVLSSQPSSILWRTMLRKLFAARDQPQWMIRQITALLQNSMAIENYYSSLQQTQEAIVRHFKKLAINSRFVSF